MATATCPRGHESTTTDYCDTCGAPIEAAPAASAAPDPAAPPASPAPPEAAGPGAPGPTPGAAAPGPGGPCPACGEPILGNFCEACGYNPAAGGGPQARLTLLLGADRAHWERMVGAGDPPFPSEPPTLTLSVEGERAMLGRIRPGHPVDVDLPLSGAAADPAVSHHQSEFVRDGATWTVRDADSSNGTWINDADAPLAAGAVHPLADGDRIFVGAWTCLRVTLDGAPPPPSPTPTP